MSAGPPNPVQTMNDLADVFFPDPKRGAGKHADLLRHLRKTDWKIDQPVDDIPSWLVNPLLTHTDFRLCATFFTGLNENI